MWRRCGPGPGSRLVPELFEDPSANGSPRTRRYRDDAGSVTADPLPDWWAGATDPLVYVTFGSVAARLGLFPDFYSEVLAAVADLPARVLVTVGEDADPQLLRPLPANVHVEVVAATAGDASRRAMVGHGGFGTTLTGLAFGVPMVVVPLFADQPYNAARVAAVGAGIAVEADRPALVLAEALRRVLCEDSYRHNARLIADEIDALPPVSQSVPFLEALIG